MEDKHSRHHSSITQISRGTRPHDHHHHHHYIYESKEAMTL
jgi:hypothetical protein